MAMCFLLTRSTCDYYCATVNMFTARFIELSEECDLTALN